ncbi:hypothetical protein PACTADRAFT_48521 [Pachysolen tannophilus NRRL Y-2460]|uniref:Transcription factor CBF/NF-Y/archaeal histone domain-containing protein n=1 Tax=Pachysolen tannophilus NRRL Y-2460 TaxID=669874 RepID=A0A1E4TY64_PACTA|nr:hypothetical protein PACTADRAFT_48521 [Pachysolen tannophilus NRRL Y-2460]
MSSSSNESTTLPQARIRKIVKLDPDYSGVSSASIQLITKATELFVQDLTSKASIETRRMGRKKINYEDFYQVVKQNPSLMFLADVVPKRYKVGELYAKNKITLKEPLENHDSVTIDDDKKEVDEVVKSRNGARDFQGILAFTNKKNSIVGNDNKGVIVINDDDNNDDNDEKKVNKKISTVNDSKIDISTLTKQDDEPVIQEASFIANRSFAEADDRDATEEIEDNDIEETNDEDQEMVDA